MLETTAYINQVPLAGVCDQRLRRNIVLTVFLALSESTKALSPGQQRTNPDHHLTGQGL